MSKNFERLLFVGVALLTFFSVNKLGTFSFLAPEAPTVATTNLVEVPSVAGVSTDTDPEILTFAPQTPTREVSWPEIDEALIATPPASVSSVSGQFKIALFGDSMIDTMGDLSLLHASLKNRFPSASFTLYNYGIGGQTVDEGLARFSTPFSYQGRTYPALSGLRPDIIILGSFAYNLKFPYDRNTHWQTFAALVETAQKASPNVYILAEIAPLYDNFASGTTDRITLTRREHARMVKEQLENAIGIAATMKVPLINVYSLTKDSTGFGSYEYTRRDDGIHPNTVGHLLTATTIAEQLSLKPK